MNNTERKMIEVLQTRWDEIMYLVNECGYDIDNITDGFDIARRFTERVTGKKVIINEYNKVMFN